MSMRVCFMSISKVCSWMWEFGFMSISKVCSWIWEFGADHHWSMSPSHPRRPRIYSHQHSWRTLRTVLLVVITKNDPRERRQYLMCYLSVLTRTVAEQYYWLQWQKTTHVRGDKICFLVFFIHERQALSTFLATLVVLYSTPVAGSLCGHSFKLA